MGLEEEIKQKEFKSKQQRAYLNLIFTYNRKKLWILNNIGFGK